MNPVLNTEDPDPESRPVSGRSLVFVGLMGAGKTSVGRAVAKTLDLEFVDADQEIERASAMPVAEIFALYGEEEFRSLERRVMSRLLHRREPCVIATGGGAFINAETRALIARRALSIWLRASLDVLVGRTAGRTHRPLLNGTDVRETLGRLMNERHPVYAQADLVVDTYDENPAHTTARVLEALAALKAGEHGGPKQKERT
ncbi:shikimate kinase [Phaeovibrio sulfidiphilus]|uniref:Shikimate kinase n=1 Tax=Phaeovibrio sulfidiphilus TaxID=1220600 RepID=A0A8J6YUJ2_9PROT|nr:shikimate kinase [Phaeovibrio sulfidiphilus]MBE1236674.1 shikimate kinase [Phaeovibrio sulfidiphilus]